MSEVKEFNGIRRKFSQLSAGDVFAQQAKATNEFLIPFNIVIRENAVTLTNYGKIQPIDIPTYAFNSIGLDDGRPRKFHPDADVYLYSKAELFQ